MKNTQNKIPPLTKGKFKGVFGFTLVELIVVITILVILGAIVFLSFGGYSSKSRDSVRISDTVNITKGLEIYNATAGKYPLPDNATVFTGSTGSIIYQGTLGDNTSRILKLSKPPLDPSTNSNYTYSVFNDGKYYQLYYEKENITSFSPLLPLPLGEGWGEGKTYADITTKTPVVKGNYKFDPSLPSLLVVSTSVNTNSGIFDPSVCFIVDGGKNTLNNCVEKKSEMSLKDYDSSLVGYWDMETLTGTMLKDLSGNGNDGTGGGGIIIGGTGGIIGKATMFNSGSLQFIDLNNKITGNFSEFTIIVNYISTIPYSYILDFGQDISYKRAVIGCEFSMILNLGPLYLNTTRTSSINQIVTTYSSTQGIQKIYLNGKLTNSKSLSGILNLSSPVGEIIGARYTKSNFFNGIIDDIKIYNRALSDEEIRQQARIAGF